MSSLPQVQSCNHRHNPALVTGLFAQALGQKHLASQSAHLVQGGGPDPTEGRYLELTVQFWAS